jgi:hypothetical protein
MSRLKLRHACKPIYTFPDITNPVAGVLWHDDFSLQTTPEIDGYAALYTGRHTLTTYEETGSWDGSAALKVAQLSEQNELDGGLYIPIPTEFAFTDGVNPKYAGFTFYVGSNFAAPLTQRYKLWWMQISDVTDTPVHSKTLLNRVSQLTPAVQGKIGYGGSLYPATTEFEGIDLNAEHSEWFYAEFIHEPDVGFTFKVYDRNSATPLYTQTITDVLDPTVSESGDYMTVIRLSAYIQGTGAPNGYTTATADSYIRYGDVYFNDSEMGPPSGFVL